MDASVPADGWPTVPNPSRVPVADLTQGVEMFADKPLLLGGSHRVDPAQADTVPCGAGCPHRLESITCPYYRQPCLVGCRVKQVLSGHGLEYQEIDIFVVAQSGQWLIGEMVVLNLAHPRSAFTRIVTNKRGAPVFAGGAGENLLDVVPATILSEKP